MNSQIKNLLEKIVHIYPFKISQWELEKDFYAVFDLLKQLNILKETESDLMVQCSTCRNYHQAHKYKQKYIIVCDTIPDAGFEVVEKEKIIQYKFQFSNLVKWLSSNIELGTEWREQETGKLWFIGNKHFGGNLYNFYLLRSDDINEVQQTQTSLNTSNPIILWLGEKPHQAVINPLIISLLDLIDIKDDGLVFDKAHLYAHLPDKLTAQQGDIELDKHILLSDNDGYNLLLVKDSNQYLYKVSIREQAYHIISFFYTIRKQEKRTYSGKDLEGRPFLANARTLSTRIKEINEVCSNYSLKPIFHKFPNNQYSLNPNLDCMK